MASVLPIPAQNTIRHIQRIQTVTIVWMTVEAAVSLSAAWVARSPALLAIGDDLSGRLCCGGSVLLPRRNNRRNVQRGLQRCSAVTGSAALRADAAESALCAYLALVALVALESTRFGT